MIKLTCHSCGGKLEITDDIERFVCGHCGTEWLVNRSGGIVSLKAVEEQLGDIKKHTSQTAEHTKETAEHSKIIADDIKLKKINERIKALSLEADRIDRNPQMKNNNKYAPLKFSAVVSFFFFCFALIFFSMQDVSIIFFILMFVSPAVGLYISMFSGDTILDKEQRYVNITYLNKISKEINELGKKAKELEASILK